MPGIYEIKTRLEGVKSIHNITYAMQIVTISRLKRINAQLSVAESALRELVAGLSWYLGEHPRDRGHFFAPALTQPNNPLVVLIFSNRGFCGSFNGDLLRGARAACAQRGWDWARLEKAVIGKKVPKEVAQDPKVQWVFQPEKDTMTLSEATQLEEKMMAQFASGRPVVLAYFEFKSIIAQTVVVKSIFPADAVDFPNFETAQPEPEAFFDPTPQTAFTQLVDLYYKLKIRLAVRHSASSEFGQRFLLMKSAVDNTKDVMDQLSLEMNKERQKAITQEIAEIIATFKALQKK
ncbi:MAG: FoF1 ATP synthase subunit gamma [Candidatus Margulisiibacteriota bacterium]